MVTSINLDTVFSIYIRTRAIARVGGCEKCGTTFESYTSLNCCHIFSKKILSTRWDTDNAFGGCDACHKQLDRSTDAMLSWAKQFLGDKKLEDLRLKTEQDIDINMQKLYDVLTGKNYDNVTLIKGGRYTIHLSDELNGRFRQYLNGWKTASSERAISMVMRKAIDEFLTKEGY